MESAWQLHKAWNKSELIIVPDCGHSGSEPPTINEIIKATNKIASWFEGE
jgi:proline iminopeptidase